MPKQANADTPAALIRDAIAMLDYDDRTEHSAVTDVINVLREALAKLEPADADRKLREFLAS